MKAIILCAGKGRRTGLKIPKCLYKFNDDTTLLGKNIENLKKCGFKNTNIILATGFSESLIKNYTLNKFVYIRNKKFESTNMIYSFNEVLKKIKSTDVYLIYADILYDFKDLKNLISLKKDIVTMVDIDWLNKWKQKKDYKDDLESLKMKKKNIISLGQKVKNYKNIDGRFVGITKFSRKMIDHFKKEKKLTLELKLNSSLDFTSFLMNLIKNQYSIKALAKKIKWNEFDTKKDFLDYEKLLAKQ